MASTNPTKTAELKKAIEENVEGAILSRDQNLELTYSKPHIITSPPLCQNGGQTILIWRCVVRPAPLQQALGEKHVSNPAFSFMIDFLL